MSKEKKACRGIAYKLEQFSECMKTVVAMEFISKESYDHYCDMIDKACEDLKKGKKIDKYLDPEEVYLLRDQLCEIADKYEEEYGKV